MSASAETITIARETRPTSPRPSARPSTRRARRPASPSSRLTPRTPAPRKPAPRKPASGNPAPRRPARARTGVFAVFVLMILTAGMLGMLWINTTLAQGAFTLTDLQQQRAQLIEVEQQLTEQLARADAPAQLEQSARALGMVPQEVPVFLRLSDGRVLGDPVPQAAPVVEEPVVEEPVVEEPLPEDVVVEDVIVEEPVAEEPVVEESVEGEVTP